MLDVPDVCESLLGKSRRDAVLVENAPFPFYFTVETSVSVGCSGDDSISTYSFLSGLLPLPLVRLYPYFVPVRLLNTVEALVQYPLHRI
jgi:hypothetical protein